MNPINWIFQKVPPPFRTLTKRLGFFSLGALLTIFYAEIVQAQTAGSNPPVRTAYSAETITAAVIGAVITVFFIRGMYLVLTYASETYGLDDDDANDEPSKGNDVLLFGAFAWIVGSALIIAAYGLGWRFLYVGPLLTLLGPIVPIVAMELDLKRYKKALAAKQQGKHYSAPYS